MEGYSDEFVLSQREYYRSILNCGPSRDWNLISGMYNSFCDEARRRNL